MTPIIHPGKSDFLAELMGGGLPSMFQDLIRAGPRIMANPLFVQPLWHGFFFHSMVEQEVSSDCCGKLPKDPCLLNLIPVNAPLNHHLNGLLHFSLDF